MQCEIFDACKMTVPKGSTDIGIWVNRSFWGVQGFEITSLSTERYGQTCFNTSPQGPQEPSIRNVVFANNVAINCPGAAFGAGVGFPGLVSVDYVAFVGNVSYGAGHSNTFCNSGFVFYVPVAADQVPGTHLYVAGNFSVATTNPSNAYCYDGNGIILDTFDGSQVNEPIAYAAQAVVENNITIGNGGVGVRVVFSDLGSGPFSKIYLLHNTTWGNSRGAYQAGNPDCGEIQSYLVENISIWKNIAVTDQPGCYGVPSYPNTGYSIKDADSTSTVDDNWGYAVPAGWGARAYNDSYFSPITGPFAFGTKNQFNTDPQFASPTIRGVPQCSTSPNVPTCMAQTIADFTPKVLAASSYGYQAPTSQHVYNALFPPWLCNVHLPNGLITLGCRATSATVDQLHPEWLN